MKLSNCSFLLTFLAAAGCWSGDFVVAEVEGPSVLGGSAGTSGAGGSPATGGSEVGGSDVGGSVAGGSAATGGGEVGGSTASGGEAGAPAAVCTGTVLFVVGSEALTRGDSAILDRLRGLGFVVSIIAATMVTSDSATGTDFVLISRSVRSPDVMASFRDQAVPLFVTEYNLYASLGMTANKTTSSGGDTLPSTELVIVDPTHPLAAGFSGTVTILTAGKGQYGFGVPGGDAVVVANLVDEQQGAAIFAYEKGAAMVGLVAPARRVGYFLDIQASTRLTAEGWAMFDAAAQWTAGTCKPR